jgi:hypothetical protein
VASAACITPEPECRGVQQKFMLPRPISPSCVLHMFRAQRFLPLLPQDTCGSSDLSLSTAKRFPHLKEGLLPCHTLPRLKSYREAVPIEECVQISLICDENLASLPIPTICSLASFATLGLEPGHMEEGDPCIRGGVGALPDCQNSKH